MIVTLARTLVLSLFLSGLAPVYPQGRGSWLDVPFVRQSEEGCGSAAISMLLQYWSAKGAAIEPARADVNGIQRALYSKEAHGIYASAVEKFVRESGFKVLRINGTWEDLDKHLID